MGERAKFKRELELSERPDSNEGVAGMYAQRATVKCVVEVSGSFFSLTTICLATGEQVPLSAKYLVAP